jgi:hypothetical protein
LQHLQAFYVAKGQTLNVIKEKTNQRLPERKSPFDGDSFFPALILSERIKLTQVSLYIGDIGSNLQYKKDRRPAKLHFGPARTGGGHVLVPVCNFSQSYFD